MSANNSKKALHERSDGLTYQQAAIRLGVSSITLRRWRALGRFKVRQFSSTLIRIPVSEIERLEKEALESDLDIASTEVGGVEKVVRESIEATPEGEKARSYKRIIAFKTESQARLIFAGQAMQALISRGENLSAKNRGVIARLAFQLADDMVKVSREGVGA